MSVTNSAFMKAYGKSPAAPPRTENEASAAQTDAVDEKLSPEIPIAATPSSVLPSMQQLMPPSVPAPHFEVTAQTGQDDTSSGSRPQRASESTEKNVALPLSRYMGLSPDRLATNMTAFDSLATARHAEGFDWPEVCQTISDAAGEEIDAIARGVLQASARGEKMIAVTGCRRGEGRTTLLQCVAQALRGSDVSVALVDADVHRPVLAERLGVRTEIGWDDVLMGTRQLPEALVRSGRDRLTLLPRRRPLSGDDEQSQRTKQEVIFRMIRDSCDVVLFDTGPLLEDAACGALWLAECDLIDAAIVVCDPHRNCQRRLSRVLEALEQRQIPPAGVVENFAENFAAVAASSGRHLRRDAPGE